VSVHGSVIGAAAALGYTPSAISQQVKKLERQTGLPLLERAGRGVLLTEHGRLLVTRGKALLDDLEQLEAGLAAGSGDVRGVLRLAAFSTSVRGVVAPALRTARQEQPQLALTVVEVDPWEAVDLVATGQVDVAVVHNWARVPLLIPEHLEERHLMTDVADLLVHRDSPLAARASVTPRDLAGQHWISTPERTICHEWLLRMYDGTGLAPDVRHWSSEFASHVVLVEQGAGISLNPRLGRGALPDGVVPVRVVDPVPSRQVRVVWRRSMAASPAIGYVADLLGRAA
jgi:DNA-binding transcriptional LysR family regulator